MDIDSFIAQINLINFGFNILKPFSLEKYIEEKLQIKKIQNNTKMVFKNNTPIKSLLFLETKNKIIAHSVDKIFLLNSKNYKIEVEVRLF